MAIIRDSRFVRYGAVFNIAAIETSKLLFLSHINRDGRDVLTRKFLKAVKALCRDTSVRFLSCDVITNFVTSKFIPVQVGSSHDSFNERSGRITLKNSI